MSYISRELSLDEELEVGELLSESGPRSLVFARGVFAAAATNPRGVDPTEWLPLVLGEQIPNAETLKRILSLLMRDCAHVRGQLEAEVDPTPESDDDNVLREYCRGYVQMAQRDGSWTARLDAFDLSLPLLVLSEYARAETLSALRPEALETPEAFRDECRRGLSAAVLGLHAFFFKARQEAQRSRQAAELEKPSRNDLCPCGSGRKYKKCCGPLS